MWTFEKFLLNQKGKEKKQRKWKVESQRESFGGKNKNEEEGAGRERRRKRRRRRSRRGKRRESERESFGGKKKKKKKELGGKNQEEERKQRKLLYWWLIFFFFFFFSYLLCRPKLVYRPKLAGMTKTRRNALKFFPRWNKGVSRSDLHIGTRFSGRFGRNGIVYTTLVWTLDLNWS